MLISFVVLAVLGIVVWKATNKANNETTTEATATVETTATDAAATTETTATDTAPAANEAPAEAPAH